jgi:hypothetical protein
MLKIKTTIYLMKLYEKIIDGKSHCKPANKIILIKDDMQIFNPTEEMLFEDGWKVHEPIPYEPTEEEIFNREKEYKIEEILRHDSSNEINSFYVGDVEMWLDKATRTGLLLRFQAEQAQGKTDTILWYNGNQFPLKVEQAIQMLYAIELYASACYDNTQEHLANVGKLESVEEVQNYDYETGYPEKLSF